VLILLCDAFGPELPTRLAALGEVSEDLERLPEAEIALVRSRTKVTREFLDAAPRLRLVIRGGVGLDNVDVESARSRNVRVCNTAEASTVAVAELAFALIIALPNRLTWADQSVREGKWLKKELERTELAGKTLGILGYGRIGEALAARARAFDMRVLGWRRSPDGNESAEMEPKLSRVVQQSHFVSLHLPLTEETRGMVDARLLDEFRDGAYLVNTGRGECIDEAAVAQALRRGKLAGFATDVWHREPPVGSPLIEAPRCILTPHLGASTSENLARIGEIVETMVREHVAHRGAGH
jgi:D-3-phosphoglycerate dehydrogenase